MTSHSMHEGVTPPGVDGVADDGHRRHEPPKVVTLGDLGDVRNGWDGPNWDWSEWYYFDY